MKLIGWETGTGVPTTVVLLGSVSKNGTITVKKELFGEAADRYLHKHQKEVNAILTGERKRV